jgi:uncharacterized protein involved in response to NO
LSLFAYGFRPFFLGAGMFAVAAVAAWLLVYLTGLAPWPGWPPQLWHGHEMLYGFVGAAVAGFLLTAVPSWTGARGFAGMPLLAVTCVWIAGRVAFAGAAWLPLPAIAVTELAFIPALAVLVAPPLLRARNRNTPLLLVLAIFWATDAAFFAALRREDVMLAITALHAGIDIVLLLVTVIGGRIVPSFTANALRSQGISVEMRSSRALEWTVIAAMVLVIVADVVDPGSTLAAGIAGVAAVLQAVRLAGWRGLRTVRQPIVWILHAAYSWLPVGLALKAVYLWSGAHWAAHWLHAFTVGTAATMILAVMTRAALGHTGRPLVIARPVTFAYALLLAAGVVRVFGPAVPALSYRVTVAVAAALWIAAFALFLVVYAPILLRPRVDGRPG